jgi:hypothetical protein
MDRQRRFYLISNQSYDRSASTIYRGVFVDGTVTKVELVPGVSLSKAGIVNFDAEINPDGDVLYFVESQFGRGGRPRTARILFANRDGDTFVRSDDSPRVMRTVNSETLNYAPATSASGLEIFFTRLDPDGASHLRRGPSPIGLLHSRYLARSKPSPALPKPPPFLPMEELFTTTKGRGDTLSSTVRPGPRWIGPLQACRSRSLRIEPRLRSR